MATLCACASCQLRRLSTALILIAIGGVLLAHMLAPSFNSVAMVATFLVFLGVWELVLYFAPRAEAVPHPPRGSIFVPLLLLVVGTLVLVRHALPQVPLGAWIAAYWPLLLIVWGLTRLIEHYTLPPRARSGMSGGEILLLILIVVFGLAFSGMYHFGRSRWANYWGVNVQEWNPFLQSFDYSASAHAALPATAGSVLVRGFRGNVTLAAGAAGSLSASLADTVHADGRDAAQRLFDAAQPVVRQEGSQWVVLPAGEGSHANVEADLRLEVPPSLPVTILLENGDVNVPGWHADLNVRCARGSITASNVQGNVIVSSGHDNVSLDHVTGTVAVTGSGDDLAISDVTGAVHIQGEFVGSLSFRSLARGFDFNSDRTALEVAALPGSLNYDMDRIRIADVSALQLRTRDAAIEVSGFTGPLTIANRNEDVTASAAAPPAGPINITDHDADVTLTLPPASRIHLEASSHNGNVDNSFPDVPSGIPVTLQTTNGTIAVRSQSGLTPPQPPHPPTPPHPPQP